MGIRKKVRNLNDHRIALENYNKISREVITIKAKFFGGGKMTPVVSGEELQEWFSSIFKHEWKAPCDIGAIKHFYEIPDENLSYPANPTLLDLFIESFYALTLELLDKLKNLKKIILVFARIKIVGLDSDRRKMIQSLKHNFRHFDDEENNVLKIARKQFYNINIIRSSWNKNLETRLMKFFPSQILTMN